MDLGQIGFDKAQAMVPYLRAMLRNVEREIVPSQKSLDSRTPHDRVILDAESSNKGCSRPAPKEQETIAKFNTIDDRSQFHRVADSDIESNGTTDSRIEGSVAASEDTLYTSTSQLSAITADSMQQPIYSWKELRDLLISIAKRTTFHRWVQIFADCEYFPPQVTLNDLYTICLRECQVTGTVHKFHESRRCIRCEVQLCQKCERCLLNRCELTSSEQATEPREEVRKDSLAAKRIWPACRSNQYHRRLVVDLEQDCRCTEFLMNTVHNCEDGKYHMCNECYANALVLLRQPNSRIVATEKERQVENHVEYACSRGASGNVTQPAVCKICLRYCHFHCLDETDKKGCAEGEKEWNQGSCPWVLKSIETSLAAWKVVKTYRCYLESDDTKSSSEGSAEYIGIQTA